MNEEQVIAALQKLNDNWPKDLWLFSNGQALYLLRKKDGKQATEPNGSFDTKQIIASFGGIHSEGGDF